MQKKQYLTDTLEKLAAAYLDNKLTYNSETYNVPTQKLETVQANFYKRLIRVPKGCTKLANSDHLGTRNRAI